MLRRGEPAQESGDRSVHFIRALLLHPVAGAINQLDEPKIGHLLTHHLDNVDAGNEAQYRIKAACDECTGLLYLLFLDFVLLRKVDIRRAVTVERSAEAAALKLLGVVVEVSLSQPRGERLGIGQAFEQARIRRLVDLQSGQRCIT